MKSSKAIIKRLAVLAEIYSKEMSEAAAELFVAQLAHHRSELVLEALERCLRELRFFPTVADVLSRLPDGRPLPEQAWGMLPRSEEESVCWTIEMVEAWSEVRHLISEGDSFNASKAFRESYSAKVAEARAKGVAPQWNISPGRDSAQREAVVLDARTRGRITAREASAMIGYDPVSETKPLALSGSRTGTMEQLDVMKLLPNQEESK